MPVVIGYECEYEFLPYTYVFNVRINQSFFVGMIYIYCSSASFIKVVYINYIVTICVSLIRCGVVDFALYLLEFKKNDVGARQEGRSPC